LDEDSQRRLQTNPLRILDSKNPAMQSLIAHAPRLPDFLDVESAQHFAKLQQLLTAAGMTYEVNPRLVRGLDYYNQTVFEWVMRDAAGAQNTVCAGGRYDTLVAQLGGVPTSAIGFAIGLERLVILLTEIGMNAPGQIPHAYLILASPQAGEQGLLLAEQVRDHVPQIRLLTDCSGGSFKSQFKRADKSGAQLALVLGIDETSGKKITVKYLRREQAQLSLSAAELIKFLQEFTG
jgi:histidyl-tRNA synthetase